MRTAAGVEASGRANGQAAAHGQSARPHSLVPGMQVTLRRPWHLRRTPAVVRRRVPGGWEVEVRTALGTPMHLVLPARALRRG